MPWLSAICFERKTYFGTKKTAQDQWVCPFGMDSINNDDSKDLRYLHQVSSQEADLPEQGESLQKEEPMPFITQNRQFDFEYSSSGEHNLLTMSFTEFYLSIHGRWRKVLMVLVTLIALMTSKWVICQGNL